MPPKSLQSAQPSVRTVEALHDRMSRVEALLERLLHIEPCSGNPSSPGSAYVPTDAAHNPRVIYDEAAHYAFTFLSGHS